MMRRRNQHIEKHENLERWLLTYADMITLLTAFFLMLYSMSVMSKGKFTMLATSVRNGFGGVLNGGQHILNGGGANSLHPGVSADMAYGQYKDAMRNLRTFVEEKKLKGMVNTREDERGVIISLVSDGMLFPAGKAQLSQNSEGLLNQVGKILKTVPNSIQIEGHTDAVPISTVLFPSNWELSTARAGSILRYFTYQQGMPGKKFSVAGYADTRPLSPNDTEANRAHNRRVDIVILKTEAQKEADLLRKSEIRRITGQPESGDKSAAPPEAAPAKPTVPKPAGTNGSITVINEIGPLTGVASGPNTTPGP